MGTSPVLRPGRRSAWVLSEASAVLLWQLGMAWSSAAAIVDASTGHRIVLSGLVMIGPCLVLGTGRWLRTAVAGGWAVGLVALLGFPDGIWGSRLEAGLITLSVGVAVMSTLAALMTIRSVLSLAATAMLTTACASSASSGRVAGPSPRPVSCREQYQSWKRGPGWMADRRLRAAVRGARAADRAGSVTAMSAEMSKLMPAAVAAGLGNPVPHCADPRNLYQKYVTAAYEVGHAARGARGLAALRLAAAPLAGIQDTGTRLDAELAAEGGG